MRRISTAHSDRWRGDSVTIELRPKLAQKRQNSFGWAQKLLNNANYSADQGQLTYGDCGTAAPQIILCFLSMALQQKIENIFTFIFNFY